MRTQCISVYITQEPLCCVAQESLSSPIDRRSDYYRQRAREQQQPQSQASSNARPQPLLTAPNVLTFARLLMVPVLVVLWFLPHRLAPLASALTFIFAAITDWADGYLARRVSFCSGTCLTPITSVPVFKQYDNRVYYQAVHLMSRSAALHRSSKSCYPCQRTAQRTPGANMKDTDCFLWRPL